MYERNKLVPEKEIPSERPFLRLSDGIFVLCNWHAAASFQPEGRKTGLRMENASGHAFATEVLFNRKAEKGARGWKIPFDYFTALMVSISVPSR